MTTISFHVNRVELLEICATHGLKYDEVGKFLKASILGHKQSPFYRALGVAPDNTNKVDRDEFLIAHSMAQIMTMRGNALSKPRLILD